MSPHFHRPAAVADGHMIVEFPRMYPTTIKRQGRRKCDSLVDSAVSFVSLLSPQMDPLFNEDRHNLLV